MAQNPETRNPQECPKVPHGLTPTHFFLSSHLLPCGGGVVCKAYMFFLLLLLHLHEGLQRNRYATSHMTVLQIKRRSRNLQLALTMVPWPHNNRWQLFVDFSIFKLFLSFPQDVVLVLWYVSFARQWAPWAQNYYLFNFYFILKYSWLIMLC